LEGLTKTFGVSILISDYVFKEIENIDTYHYRFLGKLKVKGKNEVVSVYDLFGGDPESVIEKKINSQSDFEEGLALYFRKEFAEAAVFFKMSSTLTPKTKPPSSIWNVPQNSWFMASLKRGPG
ncbi:MAG: hypothetical protein HQM13_09025, partial [SAR324 cluster bacterium]|nr:hypothetical protein [SAR324 cluster bacterium]